jgi:hypothetical protein
VRETVPSSRNFDARIYAILRTQIILALIDTKASRAEDLHDRNADAAQREGPYCETAEPANGLCNA